MPLHCRVASPSFYSSFFAELCVAVGARAQCEPPFSVGLTWTHVDKGPAMLSVYRQRVSIHAFILLLLVGMLCEDRKDHLLSWPPHRCAMIMISMILPWQRHVRYMAVAQYRTCSAMAVCRTMAMLKQCRHIASPLLQRDPKQTHCNLT